MTNDTNDNRTVIEVTELTEPEMRRHLGEEASRQFSAQTVSAIEEAAAQSAELCLESEEGVALLAAFRRRDADAYAIVSSPEIYAVLSYRTQAFFENLWLGTWGLPEKRPVFLKNGSIESSFVPEVEAAEMIWNSAFGRVLRQA